jgi:plasmid stabilization system protein ParE
MAELRIVLSNEAQRNIADIYRWIAERSTDGATRWYVALHA